MSLKGRRFSLDSYVAVDGLGGFSGRRGRKSRSLDEARLQIQELNNSLNSTMSIREHTIAEENLNPSLDLTSSHISGKHNKSFHKLFQDIPEGENLTHTFTCALQKEVLYHGKLYISENHVCFYSSVLLKDTKVVIPASSVRKVKKHNSALSMLSVQTVDDEKYSFVSLRNRELCHKLLQRVCSQAQQAESPTNSPYHSAAENEAENDVPSSYSSLEDSIDHGLSRQNSICFEHGLLPVSSPGHGRRSSACQSSSTDEETRAASWISGVIEKLTSLFFLREIRNLSLLFYIYIVLIVFLLFASGYIGLKIIALEEQLNMLGALTELSLHQREFQET